MTDTKVHPASFKDPAGFVFKQEGIFYRHVHLSYATAYEQLMASGLYAALTKKAWLVPHQEISENTSGHPDFYKTLLPDQVPFISYPYEWSFDMLKDASLLTLHICREAIRYGMIIKDATPYNIQFVQSRPVFIDTLSFETYEATRHWVAYRQFCELFLSPLLLSHYARTDLSKLLLAYPEGIPVTLCARLLPLKSNLSMLSLLHIQLQASVDTGKGSTTKPPPFSQQKLLNILDHLTKGISGLQAGAAKSTWSDYYEHTIKSREYLEEKQTIFSRLLDQVDAATALDLGANNGVFSKMLAEKCRQVVASDFDGNAINQLYNGLKKHPLPILPLVIDISYPTPAIGWVNEERTSFLKRQRYDLVVALALVHHLVIGKNIPLQQIAACFRALCNQYLIIEFVEREDEKVKILLERKQLQYDHYNRSAFEQQLAVHFDLVATSPLSDGHRVIYLWRTK